MKRVLITGAGGFIGHHLVNDQLRRGHEVTAVDLNVERLQPLADDPHLRIVAANFADAEQLDPLLPGHDVCFHLASAHLETNVDDSYFWQVNVQATQEFVQRCHQAAIGRFVHCSSVGVYGDIDTPPADEESPCHPDIAYEQSKLAGEKAVLEYARHNDYELTVVRPAWVYGPGCRRTQKLFRTVEKGRFFFVGNGRTLRHPIYIDDMVTGFELAATHPNAPGEVFIMGGPRAVTLSELTNTIADVENVKRPKLKLPLPLVWPGVYLMEIAGSILGKDMPFTRRSLKFFTGNSVFSIEKARTQLGFDPTIHLEEGVEKTYTWIEQEKPLKNTSARRLPMLIWIALLLAMLAALLSWFLSESRTFETVTIPANGYEIIGYLSEGEQSESTWVVFGHGNRRQGQQHDLYKRLLARLDDDVSVLAIDFRGFGQSEGQGMWDADKIWDRTEDIEAAVAYLKRKYDVDNHHIILMGHSLGAAQVLLAARQTPYRLVIPIGLGDYDNILESLEAMENYSQKFEDNTGVPLPVEQMMAEGERFRSSALFSPCPATPVVLVYGAKEETDPNSLLHSPDKIEGACPNGINWHIVPYSDHMYGTETGSYGRLKPVYTTFFLTLLSWHLNQILH